MTGSRSARSNDVSAELAEREGLVGKLCLPYTLRGLLRWRDGDWDASAQLFRRARELAEQVGWSEVAFNALLGLAVTQRDRGELADAEATVAQALEVCERAGLIGQSIQATSMRALLLALLGEDGSRGRRPQSRPPSWPSASTTRSAKRPCSRRVG